MKPTYDAIVIGLGAMGSAAAHQLSRRGLRVLAIEQFDVGNAMGSSHGRSRVIRKAYFEDPRYVPLLHTAYDLWREMESQTGGSLLHLVGCMNIGPREHECIRGVLESVREHGLAHEILTATEISARWPAFRPADGDVGVFEADGGYVVPEQCVRLQIDEAKRHGAVIQCRERVIGWTSSSSGVEVETTAGRYAAAKLIVTAGPWLPELMASLGLPLRVERQVQLWFRPIDATGLPEARLPSFIHFVGERAYYGIPMRDEHGMKVARHHDGDITTPDSVNREMTAADESDARDYMKEHLPAINGPLLDARVCLYTNTPDDHFIIDRDPRDERVVIAGGFSGHGFKFAPVVGSILADLAMDGRTSHPVDLFRIARFGA